MGELRLIKCPSYFVNLVSLGFDYPRTEWGKKFIKSGAFTSLIEFGM